jgi:hypothetical protein
MLLGQPGLYGYYPAGSPLSDGDFATTKTNDEAKIAKAFGAAFAKSVVREHKLPTKLMPDYDQFMTAWTNGRSLPLTGAESEFEDELMSAPMDPRVLANTRAATTGGVTVPSSPGVMGTHVTEENDDKMHRQAGMVRFAKASEEVVAYNTRVIDASSKLCAFLRERQSIANQSRLKRIANSTHKFYAAGLAAVPPKVYLIWDTENAGKLYGAIEMIGNVSSRETARDVRTDSLLKIGAMRQEGLFIDSYLQNARDTHKSHVEVNGGTGTLSEEQVVEFTILGLNRIS